MSVASNSSGAYERSTGIPSSSSFTACFWFRWTAASLSGNFFQTAFAIDNTSGASYMQFGSIGGTGTQINLYCGAGTGSTVIVDPGTAWYFYAVKGTGSSASTAYYRASTANALTSVAAGGANTPNRVYVLTDSNTPNQRADIGEIYAVKIWDAQLSDQEILAESYFVAPQRRANINSFYPFFKSGTVDEGGNAYTLTALGTPIDSNNVPPIRTRRAPPEYFLTAGDTNGDQFTGSNAVDLFDEHANAIRWFIDDMPLSDGVVGTASNTIAAITSSAAGTVAVAGAASPTIAALTSSAAGAVAVAGAASPTIAALTSSAAGAVAVAGALASTIPNLTISAAGTVSDPPIVGTLAQTIAAVTSSAAGQVVIAGASSSTVSNLTSSAAGTVAVAGTLAQTVAAITSSSAGTVAIAGALASTVANLSASAAGTVAIAGAGTPSVGAVTSTAAGAVAVKGALGSTIDPITLSAVGGSGTFGALAQTIGAVTSAAVGVVAVSGTLGATLAPVTASAAGTVAIQGAGAAALGDITLGAAGVVPIVGAGGGAVGEITASAAGAVSLIGALAATIDPITLSAAGQVGNGVRGDLAQTIAPITSSGFGTVSYPTEEYDGEVYTVRLADMAIQRVTIADPEVCTVVLADMARQRVVFADMERVSVVLADMARQIVRLPYSIRRSYGAGSPTIGPLTLSAAGVRSVDLYDDLGALVTDDSLEQVTHGLA